MKFRFLAAVAATAMVAGAVFAVPGKSQAAYFDGKTVSILVGFPPGSSATLVVRAFAPYWSKHTPGTPTFVVKNMPGAAGSKAVNFLFEKGPKDASTILFSPSKISEEVMGATGARAKHGEFAHLGLVYDKHLTMARTDAGPGLKSPADIMKAGGIKMAIRGRTTSLDVAGMAALDLLGVEPQLICCYRGAAKMFTAIQSKEAQMANVGIAGFRARYQPIMVSKGEAMGLFYLPTLTPDGQVIDNDPEFPDMPSLAGLYKQIHGKAPSGVKWEAVKWVRSAAVRMAVAAPGTNKEAVAALRQGFMKAQNDSQFKAEFKKRFGTQWIVYSGEQAAGVFDSIRQAKPEVVNHLKARFYSATKK